jgi:hypothetical protein
MDRRPFIVRKRIISGPGNGVIMKWHDEGNAIVFCSWDDQTASRHAIAIVTRQDDVCTGAWRHSDSAAGFRGCR